jgi:hypothetical protein
VSARLEHRGPPWRGRRRARGKRAAHACGKREGRIMGGECVCVCVCACVCACVRSI